MPSEYKSKDTHSAILARAYAEAELAEKYPIEEMWVGGGRLYCVLDGDLYVWDGEHFVEMADATKD